MRVGITGHQRREGTDWAWVAQVFEAELDRVPRPLDGYSSLAAGTDQIFAECILRQGGRLHAIIPTTNYDRFFEAEFLATYHRLLASAEVTVLNFHGAPEEAFWRAGQYVVDHVDLMFAVWDGKAARGLGGTADVVAYAQRTGRPVLHLDPLTRRVARIES